MRSRRRSSARSGAGERLLVYLGLGAALGLLASWLLSRRIKRHTRGLEIDEIASLADHREALLHSIREGVVAVNNEGEITLLNDSAKELLEVTDDAVGRRVDDVGLDPTVVSFLESGRGSDVVIATRTRVLALNRRAASSGGQRIGTVTTMRDSTELAAMQGQLSSHKSVTRRRAEISDAVTQRILDPAVAALLIAKSSIAAERKVALEIAADSHLSALYPELVTGVITLLGNLIDNAVDVSEGSSGSGAARVVVHIDDANGLTITVTDSGPGCTPTSSGSHLRARRHLQARGHRRPRYRRVPAAVGTPDRAARA